MTGQTIQIQIFIDFATIFKRNIAITDTNQHEYRHNSMAMDQPHYRVAMAKDIYFSALLTLLLRAILDVTLPSRSELELLLVFLLNAETAERIHSSFFTEALSDWVTRLM